MCAFACDRNGIDVASYDAMKVRLTKKLAEMLDGIDLSERHVGEIFDLPAAAARLIIAEDWAQPVTEQTPDSFTGDEFAADHLPRAS